MSRYTSLTSHSLALGTISLLILQKTTPLNVLINLIIAIPLSLFTVLTCKLLYKRYSSPLRHLPGPAVSSKPFHPTTPHLETTSGIHTNGLWQVYTKPGNIFLGHVNAIFDEPLGNRITQWFQDLPGSCNLLYFQGALGAEYVVPVGIQALTDCLAVNPYDLEKPSAFVRYAKRFLGSGLFVEEGDIHKHTRKVIRPAFQPRRIGQIKPILTAKAQLMVDRLRHQSQSQSEQQQQQQHGTANSIFVAILPLASRFALDIACLVTCGLDLHIVADPGSQLSLAYQQIFSNDDSKRTQFMYHNLAPQWLVKMFPLALDGEADMANKTIKDTLRPIVQQRFRHSTIKQEEKAAASLDLLSQLVSSGIYSETECIDQLVIILAAAYESTANTICSTIIELSNAPDIQSALRQELAHFHATTTNKLAQYEEHLDTLPPLNAVCQETLRLHPAIPLLLRKTVRQTCIDGEMMLPGTYIAIVPQAVNTATRFWGTDAKRFVPQRWMKQQGNDDMGTTIDPLGGAPSTYCMQTFLHGPRGCIGREVSICEIKRVVAALVLNFRIERAGEGDVGGFVTVKPKRDFKICMIPVEGSKEL